MSNPLKLMAMDTDDLVVMSAHVQDSVLKSHEIQFRPEQGELIIPINRFVWELPSAQRRFFKSFERRRSVLHFSKVTAVRSAGIDRFDDSEVLSLLSLQFSGNDGPQDPCGHLELNFGGGAEIMLEIECIEIRLTDLGGAWSASSKPRHTV